MRLQEDKRPGHKFELTARAPSIDTKVEAGKRLPLPRIPFEHNFRLVQILAPFLLVGGTPTLSVRACAPLEKHNGEAALGLPASFSHSHTFFGLTRRSWQNDQCAADDRWSVHCVAPAPLPKKRSYVSTQSSAIDRCASRTSIAPLQIRSRSFHSRRSLRSAFQIKLQRASGLGPKIRLRVGSADPQRDQMVDFKVGMRPRRQTIFLMIRSSRSRFQWRVLARSGRADHGGVGRPHRARGEGRVGNDG